MVVSLSTNGPLWALVRRKCFRRISITIGCVSSVCKLAVSSSQGNLESLLKIFNQIKGEVQNLALIGTPVRHVAGSLDQRRAFRADLDWLRRASASQQSIALEGGQAASLQTLASARQAFAQNLFQTRAAVTGLRQTAGAAQAAGAAAQANVIGAISGAIGTTANIYGAGQQSGWWGG